MLRLSFFIPRHIVVPVIARNAVTKQSGFTARLLRVARNDNGSHHSLAVLSLCLVLATSVFAADAGISLQAGADKNRITIGDPVAYTLTFTYPPGLKLTQPERVTQLGSWDVKDLAVTQDKEAPFASHVKYTITTFSTGTVTIPEISFTFMNNKGGSQQIKSQPLAITVDSVLSTEKDTGDIRDIKPPLQVRRPWGLYLLWLLGIAALIALAAWWYRNYKKRHGLLPETPAAPPVPPYQLAMERLEALKNSGLIAEGRIKEYYISLTDIVRDYAGAIYDIETRDRTTGEIYAELKKKEPDKKTLVFIKDFFDECDLVKFAKYRPDEKICLQDWETAKKIVEG